jgi:branched-chain amino acid transport system ATP-binding protein
MRTDTPVLAVEGLHVAYGPIQALRGCAIEVREGETVAVVGANGAGKTTLLRAVCNMIPWSAGRIAYRGRTTAGVPTHQLAKAGMLHLPEGRGVIGTLTVWENLRLAYNTRCAANTRGTANTRDAANVRQGQTARPRDPERDFAAVLEEVYQHFPRLDERRQQKAGSLSGGEQQMLALARAVVSPPQILLLDEPSLGLSPIMVREAYRILQGFRARGMTILLVEQNVRAALRFADRAYVLRQGVIVQQASGEALLADAELYNRYLGVSLTTEGVKP